MENYEVKILTKLPIALGEKLVQRFDAVKIKEGQESIKIVSAYVKRIKKVVKDTFFFLVLCECLCKFHIHYKM